MHKENTRFTLGKPTWGKNPTTFSLEKLFYSTRDTPNYASKYDGQTDPKEHIQLCITAWKDIPQEEWVHGFIHTLETIPKNWYLEKEL